MIKIIVVIITLLFSSIATTAVYHKTKQADINYYQGKAYFDRGEFKKAIPYFEKAVTIDPFKKEAIRTLAYCYQWSNRHKEAIEYFKDALERDPKDYKMKKAFADTLSWQGNYKEAIRIYLEVYGATKDYQVLKDLARVYLWDKQFKKSREILETLLVKYPKDIDLRLFYAEVLLYSRDFTAAEDVIRDIIKNSPDNIKARIYLGDLLSYYGHYPQAMEIYNQIILLHNDPVAREKLAGVLSWDRQYDESIKAYDRLLEQKEDFSIRRQKARVLGWAKRYREALKEYAKILSQTDDPAARFEMLAKKSYWDGHIKSAIDYYSKLIGLEPRNSEAMFDLSQIYSYQAMWNKAVLEYNRLLYFYPNHFRAKEGLEKIKIIRSDMAFETGYEYLEQKSLSRDTDVDKHSVFGDLGFYLNENLNLGVQYKFTTRSFTDFDRLTESEGRFDLNYVNNPNWRAGAYYDLIGYSRGINPMHTFGANAGLRVMDFANAAFFYDRKRLENNSTVIRKRLYSDNFKGRMDFDFNYRLKAGAEYTFMDYSDGNYNHQPALDLLYLISLDPKRLSLKYRYFYQNYRKKLTDYFSPKGFSTNAANLSWRHFLNKEEIFFGANDLYYELGYQASVDSKNIVCHNFNAAFYWDISKRLNLNLTFSQTESSASVYKDKSLVMRLKYYF